MVISDDAQALIKEFEGLRLDAYVCPAGKITIGYGHTGMGVKLGQKITVDEANRFFLEDLLKIAKQIEKKIKTKLSADQFGAVVSLAYNVGPISICNSTLLKLINKNKMQEAAKEFLKWNKIRKLNEKGDIVMAESPGLSRRRCREMQLFLGVK